MQARSGSSGRCGDAFPLPRWRPRCAGASHSRIGTCKPRFSSTRRDWPRLRAGPPADATSDAVAPLAGLPARRHQLPHVHAPRPCRPRRGPRRLLPHTTAVFVETGTSCVGRKPVDSSRNTHRFTATAMVGHAPGTPRATIHSELTRRRRAYSGDLRRGGAGRAPARRRGPLCRASRRRKD